MTVKRLQRPQHEPPAHGGGGEERGDLDAFCPALAEMQPRPDPAQQDKPCRHEGLDLDPHVRMTAIVLLAVVRESRGNPPAARAVLLPPVQWFLPAPQILPALRAGTCIFRDGVGAGGAGFRYAHASVLVSGCELPIEFQWLNKPTPQS